MATWLARVHFPDCQVRYARYSTVVEEVYDELFGHCRAKNETDALGDLCHRGEVSGEPAPVDRGKPLSEPGNIVPVRIEVEPDGMTWPALYCPRQKRIVGPHSKFFARHPAAKLQPGCAEQSAASRSCVGGDAASRKGAS